MKCEEVIKNNLCLGCNLAEYNINADRCKYKEKAIDLYKQKLEQMKMEGIDEIHTRNKR